jgi:hypothetical protein
VLLLEVLERRTGVLSLGRLVFRRKRVQAGAGPETVQARVKRARRRRLWPSRAPAQIPAAIEKPAAAPHPAPAATKPPEAPPPPKEQKPDMVDAFRQASRRAKDRTKR